MMVQLQFASSALSWHNHHADVWRREKRDHRNRTARGKKVVNKMDRMNELRTTATTALGRSPSHIRCRMIYYAKSKHFHYATFYRLARTIRAPRGRKIRQRCGTKLALNQIKIKFPSHVERRPTKVLIVLANQSSSELPHKETSPKKEIFPEIGADCW